MVVLALALRCYQRSLWTWMLGPKTLNILLFKQKTHMFFC